MPHTPGPWTIHEDGDANSYTILDAPNHWLFGILHNGESLVEKQRENMRLIAAAPDMRAALDALLNGPGDGFGHHSAEEIEQARAALAKAG